MDREDRLETYTLLLQSYDNQGSNKKAIGLLEKIMGEIARGELTLTPSEHLYWKEKLAERYLWTSRANDIVVLLGDTPTASMTTKMKSLFILALDELGEEERARNLLLELKPSERSSLERAVLERMESIEHRPAHTSFESLERKYSFRESSVSSLLDSSFIRAGSRHLLSTQVWLASLEVDTLAETPWDFATLANLYLNQAVDSPINASSFKIGAQWKVLEARARTTGGYIIGGQYLGPQFFAEISGQFLTDYLSISFDLAHPYVETRSFFDAGVSESRLSTYGEYRFTHWAELLFDLTLRSTHTGTELNQGQGIEGNAKIGFGERDSRVRIGPWVAWMRWGAQAEKLAPLFSPRRSILGVFGSFDWGGDRKEAWRGRVSAGLGPDLSHLEQSIGSSFLEWSAEKLLRAGVGLRLDGSFYTTQMMQNPLREGISARAQLIREL